MARLKPLFPIALLIAGAAATVSAATFAVRPDRDLVHRSDAVVIATALASYSTPTEAGGIETVTPMAIEEVIKGDVFETAIDVVEPGGVYGGKAMLIAGVPRFAEGRRVLLFLMNTGNERWSVLDLVVGKFTFAEDRLGQKLLVRDEDEIDGVDADLQPHRETRRSAERFLDFVRAEARGRTGAIDYGVPKAELTEPTRAPRGRLGTTAFQPAPFIAPYTATSYTMTISGSLGSRWSVFPNGVNVYMGSTQEPGAPGGGATAVQTAINSWDGDCASNVNYVYAGVDDGTHTQGLHGADGRNTVLFERDLSAWGIPAFSCSGSGYSGTLGIGGITSASGNNTVSGETFVTTQEADVEMNRGIANCSLLLNSGDWNSAVTHEVGHTLGFRHADQNRASSGSCSSDSSLECASSAIMTAFVTRGVNGALQTWDQHAVQAVYPGGTCGCTAPTVSISASSTSITAGQNVTLSSTTTGGVTGYQWYIGTSGNTAQPIGGATGPTLNVAPSSTTSYWLRVTNSCGSANSNTVTINVSSGPPPPPRKTPSDFNGDKHSDLVLQSSVTRGITVWLMIGTQPGAGAQIDVPPSGWTPVTTGDVDGDGIADIVIRHAATGTVDAYLMLSNGVQVKSFIGVGVSSTSEVVVGMADFDRNGTDDLLLQNTANGQVAIWYMRPGGGILTTALLGGAASPWRAVAIGDFDGDGWPDVALQNTSTGQVLEWRTQSGSIAGTAFIGSPPASWSVVAAGDVDGDGRDDVIMQNTDGQVLALLMNGLTPLAAHVIDNPGSGWILKGRGDFNGDGVADLVFQNSSTKTVQIWLLSGGNIASTGQRPVKPEYNVMVNK